MLLSSLIALGRAGLGILRVDGRAGLCRPEQIDGRAAHEDLKATANNQQVFLGAKFQTIQKMSGIPVSL